MKPKYPSAEVMFEATDELVSWFGIMTGTFAGADDISAELACGRADDSTPVSPLAIRLWGDCREWPVVVPVVTMAVRN